MHEKARIAVGDGASGAGDDDVGAVMGTGAGSDVGPKPGRRADEGSGLEQTSAFPEEQDEYEREDE